MEIVDRFIHTDVEGLLKCSRVIESEDNALDQVVDVDEIAFYRFATGIEHQGHGVTLCVFVGAVGTDESAPIRASEDIFAKRQRVFEVVFLHDPRRAQTTADKIVLNVILLEHDFFQNFGERVTAGIGGVFLLLGDGKRVRIEEMTDGAIATDQNKLAERLAGAALFEQPEEAFDGDIDHVIGCFFAGRAMNDVGDAGHGAADDVAVGDIAGDDFEAIVGIKRAIVAEGANRDVAEVIVILIEGAMDEIGTDFAGRAGNKDAFHEGFLFWRFLNSRVRRFRENTCD